MKSNTPKGLGYRWPAEWEPHEATWLSWPHEDGISFPGSYSRVIPTFIEMIRTLSVSEWVYLNVRSEEEKKEVESRFHGDVPERLKFFLIDTQEPWCRDHGAIFIKHAITGEVAITDWEYNAWGGKYLPFDKDNAVPSAMAKHLGMKSFKAGIVMEGGSIDGNGQGVILTTESCLLNPNRNPSLTREEIEAHLCDYLGAHRVIWLGDGIEGDDTDGHIDDLTRFVNANTVVTVVEENKKDKNFIPLQENLQKLKKLEFQVIELPMPQRMDREDLRLPASYANFYIANQLILMPQFKDPKNDDKAKAIIQSCFPTRKVIGLDCTELIWGLGTFHCLTQQKPK